VLSSSPVPRARLVSVNKLPPTTAGMFAGKSHAPPQRAMRINKYSTCVVLICSQVRSHPTSVLPSVGGRCSVGFFVSLQGFDDLPTEISLSLLFPGAGSCDLLKFNKSAPTR
jgi:hypothetical protein